MGACGSSSAAREDQQQQPDPPRQNTTRRRPSVLNPRRQSRLDLLEQEHQPRNAASFAASVVGWDKDFPSMTVSQLASKRTEFWDTRVQGRPECWQTIRVAVEAATEGGDLATSFVILESAEMTPFDCERADTCFTYDSKGFKYEIPLYCLYQPSNIQRDPPVKPSNPHQPLQVQPAPQKIPSSSASVDASFDSLEESKTSEPPSATGTGKPLKFKVRFSNGMADLSIEQHTSCTIGQLKTLILRQYKTLPSDRIRIYYLGKYLSQDKWNLGEIGMKKEMVLQAFIPGAKTN